MRDPIVNPPAIVRVVEDLVSLARAINAEHEASERDTRTSLEHAQRAGEMLIRAKAACKHGDWGLWVERHLRFGIRTATNYMRITREFPKSETVSDLGIREVLDLLAELGEEEEDASEDDAEVERITRKALAGMSAEQKLEVVRNEEEGLRRRAAEREARAPADAREKRLRRADDKLRMAIKLLAGLGGDEGAGAALTIEEARVEIGRLLSEGA